MDRREQQVRAVNPLLAQLDCKGHLARLEQPALPGQPQQSRGRRAQLVSMEHLVWQGQPAPRDLWAPPDQPVVLEPLEPLVRHRVSLDQADLRARWDPPAPPDQLGRLAALGQVVNRLLDRLVCKARLVPLGQQGPQAPRQRFREPRELRGNTELLVWLVPPGSVAHKGRQDQLD